MLEIFAAACNNLAHPSNYDIHRIYDMVERAYSSPGRYYHTMKHIKNMNDICSELSKLHESLLLRSDVSMDHLIFATVFHDFVYDIKEPENSVKFSILVAERAMQELGIATSHISKVCELISITDKHQVDPSKKLISEDVQGIFIDSDNSILAASPERYKEYSDQIYLEYSSYGRKLYNAGRKQFLEKTLSQPTIFNNFYMEVSYGDRARENIKNEISELSLSILKDI